MTITQVHRNEVTKTQAIRILRAAGIDSKILRQINPVRKQFVNGRMCNWYDLGEVEAIVRSES